MCTETGMLAGDFCPSVRSDLFISGTEPGAECQLHSVQPPMAERVVDPATAFPAGTVRPSTVPAAAAAPKLQPVESVR
jgi:hypothetical protein